MKGIRTDNEELGGTTRDAPILKAIGKARKIREGVKTLLD